ncbi:DUF523 and DUF1722 domain-containing protein [bacterium]|nr:DUF523 and DUF1722 domain-containing protein [bacterium]MBU1884408.1 DUF523 and DUF1722 domain-containing protein [bacterium]
MNIAVSGCLLGEKVRYDGGDKHDLFITDELGKFAELVPFCPEAVVFGTPRPTIRLVDDKKKIKVLKNNDFTDVTKELQKGVKAELKRLKQMRLSGVILKARSPSCGVGTTKTYSKGGFIEGESYGLFAKAFKEKYPFLPMEEEDRLCDPWFRENFVMQLFAYDAFEQLKASSPKMKELVDFHTRYKFLLQAKDEKSYRELGNVVANHGSLEFGSLLKNYELLFKSAIAKKSSIKRNRNVLEHMAGFFKNELTADEKHTLHEQIEAYANKRVPLIVPLSTLHLYAKKYETEYLLNQVFLAPYPKELALRSHLQSSK